MGSSYRQTQGTFGCDRNVLRPDVVMVAQSYKFTKSYSIVYLERVKILFVKYTAIKLLLKKDVSGSK